MWSRNLTPQFLQVQSTLQRTAHAVVTQFDRLARDAQRKELKEERERLAKLRMNDEEGFVEEHTSFCLVKILNGLTTAGTVL